MMLLLNPGPVTFGAEALDFGDASLCAVAGTANKCLQGVPGVSFVIVRRGALARAASRSYYLDLGRLARLQDERGTPFTPAVHAYYALLERCVSQGFVIYAGQGGLSKTLFRISTMGNLTSQDIDRLLECFARLRR